MDSYRVFYEGLFLPRAIKVLKDGILLGEPPNLWFIRDTNGDGRGDTRDDGTLKIGAGISSTVIYRGDQFGDEYRGNAFTPVGSGNLIKRIIIEDDAAEIEAEARFAYEGREFLTSTDERFRSVNIYNAPDGSIYIVDMYRGLYDYVLWVSEYLAEYTLEHGLDEPTGMFGRIYRIVRDEREIEYTTPKFSKRTATEVVEYMKHRNGHLRDQAQQILVQCSPAAVIPALEEMVRNDSEEGWTRLHALWTLEGFDPSIYHGDRMNSTALLALEDDHPRIRAAAIQILEPSIADNPEEILIRLERLTIEEEAPYVRLQLLASLGESDSDMALRLIAAILNEHANSPYFKEMALTGIYQREVHLAELLRSEYDWSNSRGEDYAELLTNLAEEQSESDLGHLTITQRELYKHGEIRYAICSACHGADGEG